MSHPFHSYIAVDTVLEMYRAFGPSRNFISDLTEHLRDGFVIGLPGTFMMARAVELPDGRRAWLVNMAAGKLSNLLKLFPFPLPWIAFHRHGKSKLKIYSMPRLTRKAH